MGLIKKRNRIAKIICVLLAALVSLTATTAHSTEVPLPRFTIKSTAPESSFIRQQSGGHQELDLSYIRHLSQMARSELKLSVADFVPSRMNESDSQTTVARQIIGHSLERWFSNHETLQGTLGESLRSLDQPLSSAVTVTSPAGVHHQIKFQMKATRALASLAYSGYVEATLAYQATSKTLGVEVSRRLNAFQKVILSHTSHPEENRQLVAWQMSW